MGSKSTLPKLEVIQGDITKVKVEAIVNAANSSLQGGGGVDGAIHRAGGPGILEECKKIIAKQGQCKTGEAVITTAGKLTARFVIHTVGPVWQGGKDKEEQKLSNCYRNSLKLAVENSCKTVAFPSISTGVYKFPKDKAAKVAVQTVADFVSNGNKIEKVVFVCFDEDSFHLIRRELMRTDAAKFQWE